MAERGVRVPAREVWASKGKHVRAAEGPALLAEQGHLHLVGNLPELEEELCAFTGAQGEPSDLGDALTWACAEFAGSVGRTVSGEESRVHHYTDAPTPGVYRWAAPDDFRREQDTVSLPPLASGSHPHLPWP
jgi:hypothetical protein